MEKKVIDIEKKFIQLFGYHMINTENPNLWIIVDTEDKEVGFIQYKKLYQSKKQESHNNFGYYIKIDSEQIFYENVRELKTTKQNEDFYYHFYIKRAGKRQEEIELDISKNTYVTIKSQKYGFMSMSINSQFLNCQYKNQFKNDSIEGSVTMEFKDLQNEINRTYRYHLTMWTNHSYEIDDKFETQVTFTQEKNLVGEQRPIKIQNIVSSKGEIIKKDETITTISMKELIQKHKIGLRMFELIKSIINEVIPFEREVINSIAPKSIPLDTEFSLFLNELLPICHVEPVENNLDDEIKELIEYSIKNPEKYLKNFWLEKKETKRTH